MIISVNVDNKSIIYGSDNYNVAMIELSPNVIDKRESSVGSEFVAENGCVSFKVTEVDEDSFITNIEAYVIGDIDVTNRGTHVSGTDITYALRTTCTSGDCVIIKYKMEITIVNGGSGYGVGDTIIFGSTAWLVNGIGDNGEITSLATTDGNTSLTNIMETNIEGIGGSGSGVVVNIISLPFESPTTVGPTLYVTYEKLSTPTTLQVQISKKENNGLSLSPDNQIIATRGQTGKPGSGGTTNRAGNGIHCRERHEPVGTLRCDLSCTSRVDPDEKDLSGRINFQTAVVAHLR